MLELKNIIKEYYVADETTTALNDVSVKFRETEFVSILGPSGCGKTTMLNIIGGLDRYTSGDLIINNKSTKEYKDRDWDFYRNHSIGFVFQTYNLIPHQTVLENVELALTLAGISKEKRRERAKEVLSQVGLADKLNSKPNQLSGGQMQRVAIARALINNPDILLADEPTGALDTKTSIQIMELLKSIAKDRLIIMVTHNPTLAESYSNRIIRLLDGKIIDDSNPYNEETKTLEKLEEPKKNKKERTSMSFWTALSLSFRNMLTKKARTLMVSFAGSIGIIGIALILSVSYGFQHYIDRVEEDTLSSYPVTISAETTDISSLLEVMSGVADAELDHPLDKVYSKLVLTKMLQTLTSEVHTNNMSAFKAYVESKKDVLKAYSSDIRYTYEIIPYIYSADTTKIVKVNPNTLYNSMMGASTTESEGSLISQSLASQGMNCFSEMINNKELIETQYNLLAGSWPEKATDMIMVVNEENEISDYILYSLGIEDQDEMKEMVRKILSGEEVNPEVTSYTYDYLLSLKYKMIARGDYYEQQIDSSWKNMQEDDNFMRNAINNGVELNITGIVRLKEGITAGSLTSTIMYQHSLTELLVNRNLNTEVVKDQIERQNIDVLTGKQFELPEITIETVEALFNTYLNTIPEAQKAMIQSYYNSMSDDEKIAFVKGYMKSDATLEGNMEKLQIVSLDNPSGIYFYPVDFQSKDKITAFISEYNNTALNEAREEDVINYTDYIGLFLTSVTTILNIITYVLIGFVSVSLIVSSIMIAVITYISVLERIKEIGILRSIGASKQDISRVFNAETLIIGFASGIFGVLITVLLNIPINLIIKHFGDISNMAQLPVLGGFLLVLISMLLTLIAGFVPSIMASKKNPVEALRSE